MPEISVKIFRQPSQEEVKEDPTITISSFTFHDKFLELWGATTDEAMRRICRIASEENCHLQPSTWTIRSPDSENSEPTELYEILLKGQAWHVAGMQKRLMDIEVSIGLPMLSSDKY